MVDEIAPIKGINVKKNHEWVDGDVVESINGKDKLFKNPNIQIPN